MAAGFVILVALALVNANIALRREYDDHAPPIARFVVGAAAMLIPLCVRHSHRQEWLSDLWEARLAGRGAGLIRSLGFVPTAIVLAIYVRIAQRAEIYRRRRVVYFAVATSMLCIVVEVALFVTGLVNLTLSIAVLAVIWSKAIQKSGFEGLTFHGLRHSASGLMRQVGAHDQLIQQRMRHTHRPTTTDIYGWVPDQADVDVNAALDALYSAADVS